MIDTRSLVDRVYDYLLKQIINGDIKYGETINIKKIAELLQVSTMPVREALKRLEFGRIVEIKPRSSCCVLKPSRKMIREVCELREVIELYAATKGRGRTDPARLKQLHGIVEEMRILQREQDIEVRGKKAITLDRAFHAELCGLAENDFMNDVNTQLSLHVNMTLIHEQTYRLLENQWAESHALIVRALEHEPERVAEVLVHHFDNVLELLPGIDPAKQAVKGS